MKAKKIIEGLKNVDITGDNEISVRAKEIISRMPVYEIFYGDDKIIAKAIVEGKHDDSNFIIYDIVGLSEEEKEILEQALGENYESIEIQVDEKGEISPANKKSFLKLLKSFFIREKQIEEEKQTRGEEIEFYLPYTYVKENGISQDFLDRFTFGECIISETDGSLQKIDEYPTSIILKHQRPIQLEMYRDEIYYLLRKSALDSEEFAEVVDFNVIKEFPRLHQNKKQAL